MIEQIPESDHMSSPYWVATYSPGLDLVKPPPDRFALATCQQPVVLGAYDLVARAQPDLSDRMRLPA